MRAELAEKRESERSSLYLSVLFLFPHPPDPSVRSQFGVPVLGECLRAQARPALTDHDDTHRARLARSEI